LLTFFLLPLLTACTDAKVKTFFKNMMKGQQGPYLRLEVEGAWVSNSSKGLLTNGHCHPAKLKIYKNGQPFNYDGTLPLNITWTNPAWATIYNTATCSTAETTVSIANGNITNSSMQLYVKSTTNITDQNFSFVLSDSAINYEASYNLFDVQNPKLKAYLPSRVVYGSGMCYQGRVETQLASGWSYSTTSNRTVNISSGIWLAGDGACASNTGQLTVFSGSSTGNFHFDPTAVGPYSVTFSSAGYDSDTLNISSGSGQNLVDHFEVVQMHTPVVGECVGLSIRLLNYDNAAVSAKFSFQMLMLPNTEGDGIFYNDPGCSSAPTSFVNFGAGMSEMMVGYRPLRLTQTLKFVHPFYFMSGPTQQITLNVNPNLGGIYLNADLPSFNGKKIIGSHEFGSQRLIPLSFPADATLTCSVDDVSYTSCGALVDGLNNFVWTLSDAENPAPPIRWLKATNIFGEKKVRFYPQEIYGSGFQVYDCDYTVGASDSIFNLNFNNLLSYDRVCLGSGVTITRGNSTDYLDINGYANTMLIGHSDGTSVIDSGGFSSADPTMKFTFNIDGTIVVANVKWINSAFGTAAIGFDSGAYAVSPTYIWILNNYFENIEGHGVMVNSSDPDLYFHINGNRFSLVPHTSQFPVAVEFKGQSLEFNLNKIENVSYLSSSEGAYGLNIINMNSSQNINVSYLNWSGGGQSFGVSSAGSSLYRPSLQISNSHFYSYPGAGMIETTVVDVQDTNLTLNNSAMIDLGSQSASATHNLLKLKNNHSGPTSNYITNNIFSLGTDFGKHILFDFGTVMNITISDMTNNQFINNAGSGVVIASVNPIDNNALSASTNISTVMPTHGDNLFCSNTPSVWTNLLANPTNTGNWNHSDASTKCKSASNVSSIGLCKSLCLP